jgi:hypothetical protein
LLNGLPARSSLSSVGAVYDRAFFVKKGARCCADDQFERTSPAPPSLGGDFIDVGLFPAFPLEARLGWIKVDPAFPS